MDINEDLVFTGFTLIDSLTGDEYNSKDLGLYRVSDNNRYSETITPTFEDKVVHVPGQKGSYYFGTKYKDKAFNINVAFDNLSVEQFKDMTTTFDNLVMQEEPMPLKLIFDDTPYKMNLVYLQNPPTFSYIPFDENEETVLKGEGTISFICFEPFARSVNRECMLYENADYYGLGIKVTDASGMSHMESINGFPDNFPLTHKVLWSSDEIVPKEITSKAIVNLGDYDISPLIKIMATKKGSSISLQGQLITISCQAGNTEKYYFRIQFPSNADYIIIDTANSQAYDNNFNPLEIIYDYVDHPEEASANIIIPSAYQQVVQSVIKQGDKPVRNFKDSKVFKKTYYFIIADAGLHYVSEYAELIYDYLYM